MAYKNQKKNKKHARQVHAESKKAKSERDRIREIRKHGRDKPMSLEEMERRISEM